MTLLWRISIIFHPLSIEQPIQPKPNNVNAREELAAIDAVLGQDDTTYLSTHKPLAARRFDRFLSSPPLPHMPEQAMDVLRDVRREKVVAFSPRSNQNPTRTQPSAPPEVLRTPPTMSQPFLHSPSYSASSAPSRMPQMTISSLAARPVEGSAMQYWKTQTAPHLSPSSSAQYLAASTVASSATTAAAVLPASAHRIGTFGEREDYLLNMRLKREKMQMLL
jgi:hypothetical protein